MLEIRPVPLDHPDARALVARALAFYVELYGGDGDSDPMDAGAFAAPEGAFFVGYLDEVPVVTGGWRRAGVERLGSVRAAEIKRMYVADAARALGLARRMLAHLETTARAAGFDALVLSTGAPQVAAVGLYASAGYERVEPFGPYAEHPAAAASAGASDVEAPPSPGDGGASVARGDYLPQAASQPSIASAGLAAGPT